MNPTRLSRDDRRAQILAAVLPVVLERGMAVTSKELADAAGVAEGTIFKAFGDKETLLRELAADNALGADAAGLWLESLEPADLTLEQLVEGIAQRALDQYVVQLRLFQMLGPLMQAPTQEHLDRFEAELAPWAAALADHADGLTFEPAHAASMLRMLVVAGSQEGAWGIPMTAADITRMFLHGVTRAPETQKA